MISTNSDTEAGHVTEGRRRASSRLNLPQRERGYDTIQAPFISPNMMLAA